MKTAAIAAAMILSAPPYAPAEPYGRKPQPSISRKERRRRKEAKARAKASRRRNRETQR